MNVEHVQVAQLQGLLWSPPAIKELKDVISVFAALFDDQCTSGIIQKVWDDVCSPDVSTSLSVLAVDRWPEFIAQLDQVSRDLVTLNIKCADAAHFLHSQKADDELKLLEWALCRCGIFEPPRTFPSFEVQDKLLLYEHIMALQEEAENLLALQRIIGLTGDFAKVHSIAMVRSHLQSYKLVIYLYFCNSPFIVYHSVQPTTLKLP